MSSDSDQPPSAPPPVSMMTQPYSPPAPLLSYFSAIPWSRNLLSSKDYYPIQTWSRLPKTSTGEDAFFAGTIATPTTIPHVLTLRRRDIDPPPAPTDPPAWPAPTASASAPPSTSSPDVMMLFGLEAPGICGHPSTAHGGIVATLIDETMSLAVAVHLDSDSRGRRSPDESPRGPIFTSQLDLRYKRPVAVPALVVVRAKVVARAGRKFWVRAQAVQEEQEPPGGHLEWAKRKQVTTDAMGFWLQASEVKL